MNKSDLKHVADLAHIGGMAKLKLADGMKAGRVKGMLKKLYMAAEKAARKYPLDYGDIIMIENTINKFFDDTGWGTQRKWPTVRTMNQFWQSLVAQSDRDFPGRVTGIINDIEKHYDRAGRLKMPNMWAADLAEKKWAAIWGIHDDGPDSLDRLKAIDEQIARDHALDEYQARFYPETVKVAS